MTEFVTISDLPNVDVPDGGDLIPLVDSSGNVTGHISLSALLALVGVSTVKGNAQAEGQTGDVVIGPDDLDDSSSDHRFTSAAGISKLNGIEEGAQVNSPLDPYGPGDPIGGMAVPTSDTIAEVHAWSSSPVSGNLVISIKRNGTQFTTVTIPDGTQTGSTGSLSQALTAGDSLEAEVLTGSFTGILTVDAYRAAA